MDLSTSHVVSRRGVVQLGSRGVCGGSWIGLIRRIFRILLLEVGAGMGTVVQSIEVVLGRHFKVDMISWKQEEIAGRVVNESHALNAVDQALKVEATQRGDPLILGQQELYGVKDEFGRKSQSKNAREPTDLGQQLALL